MMYKPKLNLWRLIFYKKQLYIPVQILTEDFFEKLFSDSVFVEVCYA